MLWAWSRYSSLVVIPSKPKAISQLNPSCRYHYFEDFDNKFSSNQKSKYDDKDREIVYGQ